MTKRQAFLLWIELSAVFMLIGAFGPWIKAFAISVSGTDGSNDGWVVVVAALAAGALAAGTYRNRGAGLWALVGGIVGSATTIYDRQHIESKIREGGEFARAIVNVGWGLNLAMIASISLGIAGLAWLFRVESESISSPSRVAVDPNSDLARAIEAGLVEYDPQRGTWVERRRPQENP